MKLSVLAAFLLLPLFLPLSVMAGPIYSFAQITSNGNVNVSSQLTMEVIGSGDANLDSYVPGGITSSQVLFLFTNNVGQASSITDIYFQDGALLGIAAVYQSSGVDFSIQAKPPNLPSGADLNPKFLTSQGFSADSDVPIETNGVNTSAEWVGIVFDLKSGKTEADVLKALSNWGYTAGNPGTWAKEDPNAISLRVGLHVQGIAQTGGGSTKSEAYINVVPEPSFVLLTGIGLLCVSLVAFRLKI